MQYNRENQQEKIQQSFVSSPVVVHKAELSIGEPPAAAQRLFSLVPQTRIVGGWLRDQLWRPAEASHNRQDIDFATELPPEQVIEKLAAAGIKTVEIGVEHGTVGAVISGVMYEITTLRRDVICDGRHAKVVFGADWQEDAQRRDFTVNALSMDAAGQIYDYCGGLVDIQQRRLRFIGDPQARIEEDYLRILRYFRFAARFGVVCDPTLEEVIAAAAPGLARVSGERIKAEMFQVLVDRGGRLPQVIAMMRRCRVLDSIGLTSEEQRQSGEIAAVNFGSDPLINLAALVAVLKAESSGLEASVSAIIKRWRLSKKEAGKLCDAVVDPTGYATQEQRLFCAYEVGEERYRVMLDSLVMRRLLDQEVAAAYWGEAGFLFSGGSFPVNGDDVIQLGRRGRQIGDTLRLALRWWLSSSGTISREEIISRLQNGDE